MLKNYFKTAVRQLLKNRLFSIVNIAGLSTGLASIMALSLLVFQYLGTDSNQKDIDQMYYLKTSTHDGSQFTATTYPLLGEIVKTCPEVEAATHIQQWYFPWLKFADKEFQETTAFGDTGYFKVFQFPFKYGNASTALKDKFSVVLSEEIASKFFGKENPVGKIMTADDTLQLTVTGVLQHVPSNSTIRPSVLLPTAILEDNADFKGGANWYNTFASNYLRLRKDSKPGDLNGKIAQIIKLNYAPDHKGDNVFAVPFNKISLENSTLIGVIIKGAVGAGIFILLIILLNLVNLNTASMYTRAKEVAIKQMMGSSKKNIVIQFCIENGLVVLIAAVLAWIFFSQLLLPVINDLLKDRFGEIETDIARNYPLVILFTVIGFLFTILAASLPALKLTAIKVTDAVKGKLTSGNYKNSMIRNLFISVQFVFATTLIGVTIVLNSQVRYMKSSSLGFNRDNIAVINLDLAFRDQKSSNARFESIVNDLKHNPHVKAVSINGVIPTDYWQNYNNYYDPATNKEVNLRQAPADAGYLPVFQIPLIQGRNFDDQLAASQKNAVLINRAAMNAFGWKDAVGKQIKSKGDPDSYEIIGVMEDFHYEDLQNRIGPVIQWYSGNHSLQNKYLTIRTDAGYLKPVVEKLKAAFREMPARRNFMDELMSDKIDKQYSLLSGILRVTNYIALLAILIASMGMLALIAVFAKQRVKEIGIRKVLGASVAGITKLLSKDFLLLVVAANLIAAPVTWYIMNRWLQDFAYQVTISSWMFIAAGLIALVIALLTVGFQAIKAARANPVKSLRTE